MAASDILGLFTTPQQYERQRQAAMEAQALQTARLSPMEQGQYGIALGAQQLGRAIGGALGGVDPQLQKITQRQQLLGMIDPNNPDSYAQAIQTALQAGDQEAAFLLRNEMMRLQEQASVAENRRLEREGRLIEHGLDMQKRGMESMALSIANGIDPETGDPIKPLFDPITRTFNQDVADQLISRFPTVGADIVKTSLESVQGIVSLQEKQAAKKQEKQAQEKSKLLFKEDGTIDQNVYDDLLALGQVGQTAIDRVLKGRESIKSMQAQQLAQGLRNPDGSLNLSIVAVLRQTPEGRKILEENAPKTISVKEGETIMTVPALGEAPKVILQGQKVQPFTGTLANAANLLYQTTDPKKIFDTHGQAGLDKVNQKAQELAKVTTEPSVGSDREAIAKDLFFKSFSQLTQEQVKAVNAKKKADDEKLAREGAPSSGIKEYKDIPKLRADILSTVKPFRDTVNSTDFALENLNLSIKQNNFSAFNAARVQLAKALAGGDLSQKEIQAAGGDPSILGQLADVTSTAFTGTPTIDTQKKIEATVKAIRKVALQKGRAEIEAQRTLAKRSNFTDEDFDLASDIPEFRKKPSSKITESDNALINKYLQKKP